MALLACIGGFLFGFDTAVIDSVLDFISYQLSDLAKGYLVAGASIGAAVGAWMAWSRPRGLYSRFGVTEGRVPRRASDVLLGEVDGWPLLHR